MRISGNYFDRLLIKILPYTVIAFSIIYFIDKDINAAVAVSAILNGSLWLIDTLIIYFRFKPKTLRGGKTLRWGRRRISLDEVDHINPVSTRNPRWRIDIVELHLTDGSILRSIDKPQSYIGELLEKPSRTIKRLIKRYPELEGKDWRRRWV
jgi:hypothetical protein